MNDFLLLTNAARSSWSQEAYQALLSFGHVTIVDRLEEILQVAPYGYRLILIDATGVQNLPDLVARLRRQAPKALIVVSAAAPKPREVRNYLLAGADDAIIKSSRARLGAHLQRLMQASGSETLYQRSVYLA